MENGRSFCIAVIEVFESFLESKNIDIPNSEKEEDEYASNIYGSDFGFLEDEIWSLMAEYGLVGEEKEEETAMENQKKEAPKKINVEVNGEKANNWKDGLKRFGIAAVKALAAIGNAVEEDPAKELNLQTEVTLKAEDLKQLCGMSSWQLERIFKGKKVKLADDPAVYRELKNFSSWQLEKIFGEED